MNARAWLNISLSQNERGAALITGLLLVLVLTILSMAAMMSTATEMKIATNDRTAKRVFYVAEAGLEDARSRLQAGASASPITDQSANPGWKAFVGTAEKAAANGYDSANGSHARYDSLNASLEYVVTVAHKVNASSQIIKWGDVTGDGIPEENTTTGMNIFVISSEGYDSDGASKPVQIEATQVPAIPAPAALYTKQFTIIQGTSTNVLGLDHCGTNNVVGVLSTATVDHDRGTPMITGYPDPVVELSQVNIDVQRLVDQFKGKANYSYHGNNLRFQGISWGSPVPGANQQEASTCSTRNVVYHNTNNTSVTVTGGSRGCGMLLVEGSLIVEGGFEWYGTILVTGEITFRGGGGKNVTGAMMAGGSVSADLIAGDANIVYCSRAVNDQTDYLPLITLRWLEQFS